MTTVVRAVTSESAQQVLGSVKLAYK